MLDSALRQHFETQAAWCERLGSPFTAHLCLRLADLLGHDTPVGRHVAEWPGDPDDDALALRLCGALHAGVRARRLPGLAAFYPPSEAWRNDGFDLALKAALADDDGAVHEFIKGPPQTNEVARSGVLLGALLHIAAETGAAIELLEIGSSAGLNLWPDHWRYDFGGGRGWGMADAPVLIPCRWTGVPPLLDRELRIAKRAGCDLAPVDPADAAARDRMLAYLWPDQLARMARAEAALAFAARQAVRVERASADDWIARRLAAPQAGQTARVLMHSVMWHYMPRTVRDRIVALMAGAGARASAQQPLCWVRLERAPDGAGAELRLTLWPGGAERCLARADFHGQWAEWLPA